MTRWALAAALAVTLPLPALADSGLKLPRFASLRADRVNLRTGPGERHPIRWILLHRGMPVKIVGEFDTWRQVRDREGTQGWIHVSMLSGKRTAIVKGDLQELRRRPEADSPVVARVEGRVVGRILERDGSWSRLEIDDYRGWIETRHLWGVDTAE